jgi:hypothetical protein
VVEATRTRPREAACPACTRQARPPAAARAPPPAANAPAISIGPLKCNRDFDRVVKMQWDCNRDVKMHQGFH